MNRFLKKVFYCDTDKILFHIILLCNLLCCNVFSYGNNASYISLSNQIAKNAELQVVGNNVANANTIGYEADTLLFRNIDVKQSKNRKDSFVYYDRMYKREGAGTLKVTNRNLDLAIGGKGFFKILTPRGPRFTLNGSILVNSEYVLVNSDGMPFASRNNQPITLPVDFQSVDVMQDGTINVTVENVIDQIDIIGIFDIEDYNQLAKEGNSLYNNKSRDILMDEYTIVSGALRDSNVNSAQSMTDMIDLQRSSAMATNLLSNLADNERSLLTKIAK